ncbi:hypothetical protein WJX73_008251 [Symbiochloris irregularis]|uniref:UGP3-like C-terminal hexapeptide repeats domain-containing protein n=1 Tax=Symbiochloris irregularis TaxID=706552 RepID=A0AAW1NWQ7_9CHLO
MPDRTTCAKITSLQQDPCVAASLKRTGLAGLLEELTEPQVLSVLSLLAMGQEHVLQSSLSSGGLAPLCALLDQLAHVETFYDSIGGLLGYQRQCLQLLIANAAQPAEMQGSDSQQQAQATAQVQYHMPQGLDLASYHSRQAAVQAVATGLDALPYLAEIYPLGGAGDRLGLQCPESGECMPAAVLPYCGRTMLEALMRDLQAREFLYYKLFGRQYVTPVVVMTSDAKNNHARMLALFKAHNWFGRGEGAFKLFKQPLVPVLRADNGQWIVPNELQPLLKPGGHGALWKLMHDTNTFGWLAERKCQAAIVRQISNPMAGTDATLLGLAGAGYADGRSFGFAACERAVGAAEGINLVQERRTQQPGSEAPEHTYNVTNVEYTEFEKLGISDECAEGSGYSRFPANTNVLYVGLRAAALAVKAGIAAGGGAALPGMIFNGKKQVSYTDAASGEQHSVRAGRLECTMQNLVDSLGQRFQGPVPAERHAELNTFVVFNRRRKVTSSAKRRRVPGSTHLAQTPDGSFLDLQRNAADLLQRCGFRCVPEVGEVQQYLETGPGFIFLFHPALGPLWDVISQKIRGGSLAPRSELVLEVAEAAVTDLCVDGSLVVTADCPLGQVEAASAAGASASALQPVQSQLSRQGGSQLRVLAPSGPGKENRTASWKGGFKSGKPGALDKAQVQPQQQAGAEAGERLRFSSRCGRVRLTGVVVRNRGIDWEHPDNVYWRHQVHRHESVNIRLHGQSEFEASHVVIEGAHTFEVPDGYRMVVTSGPYGGLRRMLHPLVSRRPTWEWGYSMGPKGDIHAAVREAATVAVFQPPMAQEAEPFSYVI